VTEAAKIGQFAENQYWNKASGLMDQMACGVGGCVLLDFAHDILYKKVEFSFEKLGYQLFLVNTGKGHADLTAEYSAIPQEMNAVAHALGVSRLIESDLSTLLTQWKKIESKVGNDRAMLRALHFYQENERVDTALAAIQQGDTATLLRQLTLSGQSSAQWLQNSFSISTPTVQKITLTLAHTQMFLDQIGDGCCRVHGGGFAGVILSVVPSAYAREYQAYMENYLSEGGIYPISIRSHGAICLDAIT
jgi:galactokinase